MASFRVKGGRKLAAWMRDWNRVGRFEIEVGFIRPDKHPSGMTVAAVAKMQEYGTTTSPPRPFIRAAISSFRSTLAQQAKKGFNQRTHVPDEIMAIRLAQFAKDDIRKKIFLYNNPPNAYATVLKKGSNNPLIHTKFMMNHVRYRIHRKRR